MRIGRKHFIIYSPHILPVELLGSFTFLLRYTFIFGEFLAID
jgi:hypothetical protein